jgi:hypothetical protein
LNEDDFSLEVLIEFIVFPMGGRGIGEDEGSEPKCSCGSSVRAFIVLSKGKDILILIASIRLLI